MFLMVVSVITCRDILLRLPNTLYPCVEAKLLLYIVLSCIIQNFPCYIMVKSTYCTIHTIKIPVGNT